MANKNDEQNIASGNNNEQKIADGNLDNKIKDENNPSSNEDVVSNENNPVNDELDEGIFLEIQNNLESNTKRKKEPPKKHEDDKDDVVLTNQTAKNKILKDKGLKEKSSKEEKLSNDKSPADKAENQSVKENKKKAKKSYEKTTFMHKIRVLTVLLFLGIFTGCGLGVWYFNVNLRPKTNYGNFVIAEYQGDVKDVLSKEFGVNSNRENWAASIGNKKPSDLSPTDNFLLATYNATLAKSFVFTGNGESVAMKIKQTVYSMRRFDGNTYTFEAISKGTGAIGIEMANLDVYKKGSKEVELYSGRNISRTNADWYYNKTISTEEYEDMVGVLSMPSGITPYIISEKTVKSCTAEEKSDGTGNTLYTYTFELDPVTSVLSYYKEMKRTGSLEGNPEFTSVKYIMTIDEKWNLVTTEVFETYSAIKFGMKVSCNGTIKIDYDFNPVGGVKMPTLRGK